VHVVQLRLCLLQKALSICSHCLVLADQGLPVLLGLVLVLLSLYDHSKARLVLLLDGLLHLHRLILIRILGLSEPLDLQPRGPAGSPVLSPQLGNMQVRSGSLCMQASCVFAHLCQGLGVLLSQVAQLGLRVLLVLGEAAHSGSQLALLLTYLPLKHRPLCNTGVKLGLRLGYHLHPLLLCTQQQLLILSRQASHLATSCHNSSRSSICIGTAGDCSLPCSVNFPSELLQLFLCLRLLCLSLHGERVSLHLLLLGCDLSFFNKPYPVLESSDSVVHLALTLRLRRLFAGLGILDGSQSRCVRGALLSLDPLHLFLAVCALSLVCRLAAPPQLLLLCQSRLLGS